MKTGPEPGSIFADRYEILETAGQGGAAMVYRARDRKYDRIVALKVLHPELTHSMSAERFAREIDIAAKLTHPNILQLYDSGDCGGCFYCVTPFIEGESLRDRLEREGRLPVREALGIARAAAAALEYAHARGVVHRDIKPENILLIGGQPLVADFGIARVLEPGSDARMTSTGMIVGTPAYMSPEQAAGEAVVDARSDLYSLGCVLFEMLVGRPAFEGSSPQAVITARFTRTPPDVSLVRPGVPPLLAQVTAAMLERSPADRVQTAAELRGLLDAIDPEPASLTGTAYGRAMHARWLRSRRHAIAAAVAVALLIPAGAWFARGMLTGPGRYQTVAVLPLTNLSGEVQYEFMADALTDALITDLSRLQGVQVSAMTSVMQYKMMRKPIREIARELNVDVLVEGTYLHDGDVVTITAALVRGSDERSIWRDRYVGRVDEVQVLQRQVGVAVAREIGVRLAADAAQLVVKPESDAFYKKGRFYASQWRLEEALAALQRAVEIDPTNASAYAAMARAHYFRSMFGEVAPLEAFSQMRRAAAAALAQDPGNGEAHGLMALVNTHFDYDWAGAEQNFREALRLSPSNAQVHHDYAHFLLAMGRGAESVEASARAVQLDPVNPMLMSCLGWHSLFDDRFDDALRHAGESQMMMPSFWGQIVQGWAQAGQGQRAASVESMRAAVDLAPDLAFARAALAHSLAQNGEEAGAREILEELLEESRRSYVSAYDIALVYAGLGDNDSAFEWIAQAVAERSIFVVHLTWDSRLEPLRADRRFATTVQRLGIPTGGSRSASRTVAMRPGLFLQFQRSSSQPASSAMTSAPAAPAHISVRVGPASPAARVLSMPPARTS